MAWSADELIAPAGGDWTTLAAFEGDHDGDTVTSNDTCQARVKGVPGDTGTVYWNGWQSGMDSTTRIKVIAESGSETDGTDGSGDDAVIEDLQSMTESTNAFYIDWINVEVNGVTTYIGFDGGGEVRIAKCFYRDNTQNGIQASGVNADITLKVGGTLFRDVGTASTYRGAVYISDSSITTPAEIFNCTAVANGGANNGNGIAERNGASKVRNCACADYGGNDFFSMSDEDYCASKDATAGGGNSTTVLETGDSDDFTAPSTDDFTIYDTDSVLYEAGEARAESWFTTLCPTDLLGTSWRGTPAIGCYELVVAVGGPPVGSLALLGVGI